MVELEGRDCGKSLRHTPDPYGYTTVVSESVDKSLSLPYTLSWMSHYSNGTVEFVGTLILYTGEYWSPVHSSTIHPGQAKTIIDSKCTHTKDLTVTRRNSAAYSLSPDSLFHDFSHGKLTKFAFILNKFIISYFVLNNQSLKLVRKCGLYVEIACLAIMGIQWLSFPYQWAYHLYFRLHVQFKMFITL